MSKQVKKREPDLPYDQVAIETQMQILEDLVDYYQKENEPVNASDIQDLSAAKGKIPSTLKYFSSINWLKAEKQGYYIPCSDLMKCFDDKESEEFRNNLVDLIKDSETGDKLVYYVIKKEPVKRNDVISYMKKILSLEDKRIPKLTRLIDLFIYLSVFNEEDDFLVVIKKTEQEYRISSTSKIKQLEEPVKPVKKIIEITDEEYNFENKISFLFEINPEIDEEKLRKSIRIILEELKGFNNGK